MSALRLLSLFACAAAFGTSARAQTQDTLVAQGSVWKYLDDGTFPGAAWSTSAFDDTAWDAGPAQLGYGDGGEATEVDFGPDEDNKYPATYFRREFNVADPSLYTNLSLRVMADDGMVVYLNGTEVGRRYMPFGSPTEATFANDTAAGAEESFFSLYNPSPTLLTPGTNLLAVEVHQVDADSSDISFDLQLYGADHETLTRGPYLQTPTPTGVTVRWKTDLETTGTVWWGSAPGALTSSLVDATVSKQHGVVIGGLSPDTVYYYAVGVGAVVLSGGDTAHTFRTPPLAGTDQPMRIWVLGDSGTANSSAQAVRDAYTAHTGATPTDFILMLGDNAYNEGTGPQYQAGVFDTYEETLRNTYLWPTRGNHDTVLGTYNTVFNLPTGGEAGGMASGTESYYSFDWANVHFVCLDSEGSNRAVGGSMWAWLESDLMSTDQDWIVAFWHHPPYTKGSHDSDTETTLMEMRSNFLPLLESHGVDLVLSGHSHAYERSYLIDGHYGLSGSFGDEHKKDPGDGRESGDGAYEKAPIANAGAVYCVTGSAGKVSSDEALDHPVMVHNQEILGSLILEIDGGRLDGTFLDSSGVVGDTFTLLTYPDEGLSADTTTISVATGGTQSFSLDAGIAQAGQGYFLLGSASGTSPGSPVGAATLPLNPDPYTSITISAANTPVWMNTTGLLDGSGTQSAALNFPPASPALVGFRLHHAYIAFDMGDPLNPTFVSNAFPLLLGL